MKGEGHVQFHNYLVPLKKRNNGLDGRWESERVQDLKAYLSDYAIRFE